MRKKETELSIRKLTSRQHAAISRRQALALGMGRKAIQAQLDSGSWVPTERGTYTTAGSPQTWEQRVMSAVLSGGRDAVASHSTAAALWRLIEGKPSIIEVTVPHDRRPDATPRRILHRSRVAPEIRRVSNIPVTSPARTLVDLAGKLDAGALETALDDALKRHLVSVVSLRRYIQQRGLGNRRGITRLRRLLDDREKGIPESELERRFLKILNGSGIPQPTRQHRVGRRRIDFAYIEQRIAIELDGFADHGRKPVFEEDRRRQNALVLEGWVVLRFTWNDVTKRSDQTTAVIKRALSEARAGGGI